jgi:hypothetical protein
MSMYIANGSAVGSEKWRTAYGGRREWLGAEWRE